MADELEDFYVTRPGALGAQLGPERPITRSVDELEDFYTVPPSPQPPTLGQGTPRISPYDAARRRTLRDLYSRLTGQQKVEAFARTALNAIPIAGTTLQPSDDPLIQQLAEGSPGAALGARFVGGGLPYIGTSGVPVLGRLLMGTVPRAIGSGAAIEGFNEQSRGGEFSTGATRGGFLGGLPGAFKVITPRRTGAVMGERQDMVDRALRAVREQHTNFVNSPVEVARIQRIISTTPPNRVNAEVKRIQDHYDSLLRRTENIVMRSIASGHAHGFNYPVRNPLPGLAELPHWMNVSGGALLGQILTGQPVHGAFAGWGIGQGARIARNVARRISNTRGFNRWYNNQIFPDPAQQFGRGIVMSTNPMFEELYSGAETLGTEDILRMLRGNENAPQR